jgi:hypothetical protein
MHEEATGKTANPGAPSGMAWHQSRASRWLREREIAQSILDECAAHVDDKNVASVGGVFNVTSEHGHIYESVRLRIVYPVGFPAGNIPPTVYLVSHRDRWRKGGDSHINDDWSLCLFVPAYSKIDFADANSLELLFAVIQTFLFKEWVYQGQLAQEPLTRKKANWPGEARSHGPLGVAEAILENGRVGRNSSCPCSSGKKYKHCCMKLVEKLDAKRRGDNG